MKTNDLHDEVEDLVTHDGRRVRLTWVRGPQAASGRVVLFHGFGQNNRTWQTSRRSFFAALCRAGYEVAAVELRGSSGAEVPPVPAKSFAEYLEFDLPAVWNRVLDTDVVLIGHSMGGLWSLETARQMPHRVKGVVCWASPAGIEFAPVLKWVAGLSKVLVASPVHSAVSSLPAPFVELGRLTAWSLENGKAGLLPEGSLPFTLGSTVPEEMAELCRSGFAPISWGQLMELGQWSESGRFSVGGVTDDLVAGFADVTCPTLLISSKNDHIVPYRLVLRCHHVPRSSCVELDGGILGHLDIVVSTRAEQSIWPEILNWMAGLLRHEGSGVLASRF